MDQVRENEQKTSLHWSEVKNEDIKKILNLKYVVSIRLDESVKCSIRLLKQ